VSRFPPCPAIRRQATSQCSSHAREQARVISFAALSLCHRSRREPTAPRHARVSSIASACQEPLGAPGTVRERKRVAVPLGDRRLRRCPEPRAGHLLRDAVGQVVAEQLCEEFVGSVDAVGVFERVKIHQEPAYHGERERC
jgi:hypothetical protein